MATIKDIGKPGPIVLHPYVLYPQSFMDRETLEIDWDKVRAYMKKHQDYWKQIPIEDRY